MCKCKEKYDFEYIKTLAIRFSRLDKKDVAIYQMTDNSYNFGSVEFVELNELQIIEIIKYK